MEAVFGGIACTTWASAGLNPLWTLAIIKYYYSESHSLFCCFPCSIWFYFLSAGWIGQLNTPITLSTHSPFKVSLGKQYIMFSAWMPVKMTNGHVSVHSICTKFWTWQIIVSLLLQTIASMNGECKRKHQKFKLLATPSERKCQVCLLLLICKLIV